MSPKFKTPTLVTLTAPTCAGKSYLLEILVAQLGFQRIVSTTTREPRAGEIQGIHYHFISAAQSVQMELDGQFAELVTFNGVRYGVTHQEMANKMLGDGTPPMVILEPNGVRIYEEYCRNHGWNMCKIFVHTPEAVRVQRLAARTTDDIIAAIKGAGDDAAGAIQRVLSANNRRLSAILGEERTWFGMNEWDIIVKGTDSTAALDAIVAHINKS